MPHKFNVSRQRHFKKAKYRQSNYSEYNQSLRNRGRIDIWLSDEVIQTWTHQERIYDGTGSSLKYPDTTIQCCHYIRLAFHLPLRQTQGFVDSLLKMAGYPHLSCPDYSILSRRLARLSLKTPQFKLSKGYSEIAAIAIDSTGLKVFGKEEWHQEKYKVNAKRTWRKAHFAVTDEHMIDSAVLTENHRMDDSVVNVVCEQLSSHAKHISADKMYDTNAVYQTLENHSPDAEIAIPLKKDTYADDRHHKKRMSSLIVQSVYGEIGWQKRMRYGQRNVSENAMHRYKKIIGCKLHSRNFKNQEQEMMLGASILNKFTQLGMPQSYRVS